MTRDTSGSVQQNTSDIEHFNLLFSTTPTSSKSVFTFGSKLKYWQQLNIWKYRILIFCLVSFGLEDEIWRWLRASSIASAWIRPVGAFSEYSENCREISLTLGTGYCHPGILPLAGDQCDTAQWTVDLARIYVTADIYSELNWTVTSHQYQHSLPTAALGTCLKPGTPPRASWIPSTSRFCFWRNKRIILTAYTSDELLTLYLHTFNPEHDPVFSLCLGNTPGHVSRVTPHV